MDDKAPSLDILNICNVLRGLGFVVKDIYKDKYACEEDTGKRINLKCNLSGIKVVLESNTNHCNCPDIVGSDDSEKWEMSGTSHGVQVSKSDGGSEFRRELSKNVVQRIRQDVLSILALMQQPKVNPSPSKNLSISSSCLHTSPQRLALQIKVDTPSRYRSLDTLHTTADTSLPEPRALTASQKIYLADSNIDIEKDAKISDDSKAKAKLYRQNTYTTSSVSSPQEPRTMPPSRTSSPLPTSPAVVLLNLHQAEKITKDLLQLLQESIHISEYSNFNENKSIDSIANVSRLSNIQPVQIPRQRSASTASTRSTLPYSSSPNLCRMQEQLQPKQTQSLKRLSLRSPTDFKAPTSRLSIPRSVSSSIKSLSPSFGSIKERKDIGAVCNQLTGSYKSLSEKKPVFKSPLSPPLKEKTKKRTSLYSHIKSTIPKSTSFSKK